jgi:hypothetical protein
MKHFKLIAIFAITLLSSEFVGAQAIQFPSFSTVLSPANPFVSARVRTNLLTHWVSGNEGSFTAADKWIGIGAPTGSLYGERTQWGTQAFIKALRDVSGVKNAIIEWGNQGGEMQFRYLTNPSDPINGFTKIQSHTAAGNSYFGLTPAAFGPKVGINTTNQFGTVAQTTNSFASSALSSQNTNFSQGVGFYSSVSNAGSFTGVTNYGGAFISTGSGASGRNFGVYAIAGFNCANTNYGVFAQAPSACPNSGTLSSTNWAGYFQGDLFVSGNVYFASDKALKVNVQEETGTLERLLKLVPVNYTFDPSLSKELSLAQTLQHGLIAQEVQAIYPELVTTSRYSIPGSDGLEKSSKEFLSVDYVRFVPLLLQGIKEQQNEINMLKEKLGIQRVGANSNGETTGRAANAATAEKVQTANGTFNVTDFKMSQNTPNPFSSETTVQYSMPKEVTNAQLAIFDLNGTLKMQFNNLSGTSRVIINGNSLQAGMYIYSLLVGGNEVISKKMILTK